MSRYKLETIKTSVPNAIDIFYADTESLAEELREIVDNAEGGLAETPRIQTLGETADILEGIDGCKPELSMEAEELLRDVVATVGVMMRGGRKRGAESRATRASNIANFGRAAAEEMRGVVEKLREDEAEAEKLGDELQELEEAADALDEAADEVESAEFPGMFG